MHWLSIIRRIMKAHMNSQNNEAHRHTPTLVISVIFANNRWKLCFHWKKQWNICLLWRCCWTVSIFYHLDPHHSPAWVHPLALADTPWGCARPSPAPLAMARVHSWARHPRFSSMLHTPSFLTADYHTHTVALNQFNAAVIRSWGHCEPLVVSRRWMFIFLNWDWVVPTKPRPWLLANISKSSPCSE